MSVARALRTLGPIDLRNVGRDPLLKWIVLYPFLLAVALRIGVPLLGDWLAREWGFDLSPYHPLIASFVVGMAPGMAGTVIGFLLLDERDDRTLAALLVTPLPLGSYLAYRLAIPTVVGFLVTLVAYPLTALVPVAPGALVAASALAGLWAPIVALFLAAFAQNKIAGFAFVKILGVINMLPVVGWFLEMPAQLLVGVVPAYWPMKMIWQAASGEPVAGYAAAGTLVALAAVGLLLRPFRARAFRQ